MRMLDIDLNQQEDNTEIGDIDTYLSTLSSDLHEYR